MPELRGVQATPEVIEEWIRAYRIYLSAPGDPFDAKKDRTERINHVAHEMNLRRKQAKRRVRNYEAWYRNMKKGAVPPFENMASLPEARPIPPRPGGSNSSRNRYAGQGRSQGGSQRWPPREGSR
ncbi:MAG: hypothetical protein LC746_17485 [Acidobacteria bacterium]|nr:hypothetical protein [Acidobacteriota bacterium]